MADSDNIPGLSVKWNTGKCFSKTRSHLLNDYYKAVSCELQLEGSLYSKGLAVRSNKSYQ